MSDEKVRITLDLPTQFYERLEKLVEATDAPSKAAVVRKAITLYDLVTSKLAAGYELRMRRDGEPDVLILPVV
jgi:Arc/MetJ-type ribon-helix-helix transcriptional regulator